MPLLTVCEQSKPVAGATLTINAGGKRETLSVFGRVDGRVMSARSAPLSRVIGWLMREACARFITRDRNDTAILLEAAVGMRPVAQMSGSSPSLTLVQMAVGYGTVQLSLEVTASSRLMDERSMRTDGLTNIGVDQSPVGSRSTTCAITAISHVPRIMYAITVDVSILSIWSL